MFKDPTSQTNRVVSAATLRFFNTAPLLATAMGSLLSAKDICPGTYCTLRERCKYQPDTPHYCDSRNNRNVVRAPSNVSACHLNPSSTHVLPS